MLLSSADKGGISKTANKFRTGFKAQPVIFGDLPPVFPRSADLNPVVIQLLPFEIIGIGEVAMRGRYRFFSKG